jgi:hypothetical protein
LKGEPQADHPSLEDGCEGPCMKTDVYNVQLTQTRIFTDNRLQKHVAWTPLDRTVCHTVVSFFHCKTPHGRGELYEGWVPCKNAVGM